MGSNFEVIGKIKDILEEHELSFTQLVEKMANYNSTLLQLSDKGYEQFSILYKKISDKDFKEIEKGKLLEDLMCSILNVGYPTILECRKNCRTSTNEIDILISWTQNARLANINSIFPCFGDYFLCECKNYKGKVSVTYVGKFYSLIKVSSLNMGVFIVWEGVTGKSKWSDAKGLIKKIALSDKVYIIVVDKNDLKRIYDRETNIFTIIQDKYTALKNDIDYSQYLTKHESEQLFINLT